ncbi:hypothetical protein LO763_22835 [Glycomyces sp. A-F 0318]|uniref:hypothetical protein n=1 Tax=Glycomyces amatae TaxID=2881355 RepID=UPI001E62C824|nr:hypothetical protein [Glycomyces amatae]MCD0446456.1 hypothetical protein [Glycomyces amatae]
MALKVADLFTNVDMDTRGFDKGAVAVEKSFDRMSKQATAFANVGAKLGMAVLATSAVSLGSALVPAAGILTAVPALAGGASAALISLSLAVDGVGEALSSAAAGDMAAFEESLQDLPPAARTVVRELGGSLVGLQETAQSSFFTPMTASADGLADRLSGPLNAGIESVSLALGGLGAEFLETATSAQAVAGIADLFDETAEGIDNARAGFGVFLQGLGDLTSVFIPGMSDMGAVVGDGLTRWGQWMSEIAASGQALAWFDTAKDAMGTLWSIAGNLVTALYGIFTAADGSGLLGNIEALTAQFAEWANSAEGQRDIAAIMSLLGSIAQALMQVIPVVASAFADVAGAIGLLPGPAQHAIAILGAAAIAMQFLGGLAIVQGAIVAARWGLAFGSIVVGAARASASFFTAAGQILLAAGRITLTFATVAARVVAGWLLMGVQSLLQAGRMAAAWVLAMGPVGWVIAAIVGLAALIVANWDAIVAFTKSAFAKVGQWLQVPFQWVKQHWPQVKAFLTNPIGTAVNFIRGKKDEILKFFRDLPGNIKSKLSALSSFLLSPFKSAFNAVASLWNNSLGSIRWEVPSWVPGVGGNSIGFPQMPYLADGGLVRQAGLAMVGERGPEVLHLPKGAAVSPLDRLTGGSSAQVNNQIDVTVRLGDREIRDIVGVEINERNRAVRRRALAGATA